VREGVLVHADNSDDFEDPKASKRQEMSRKGREEMVATERIPRQRRHEKARRKRKLKRRGR
jgi:hypothetical protein